MSLAESYQDQFPVQEIGLVGPEISPQSKAHVGTDEAARLMAVGSFNARIQARKVMLESLRELPFPAFGGQDAALEEEIERLRSERDEMIDRGVRNPHVYTQSRLTIVESPQTNVTEPPIQQPTAENAPESLFDQVSRLEELALAYTSLAHKIGGSLELLRDGPEGIAHDTSNKLFEIMDGFSTTHERLIGQSDAVIDHFSDNAEDTDAIVEPDPTPAASAEVPAPSVAPVAPAQQFEILPDHMERIASLIARGGQIWTKELLRALTGKGHLEPDEFAVAREMISKLKKTGVITSVDRNKWTGGDNAPVAQAEQVSPKDDFEKQLRDVRLPSSNRPWKPAQRGRGSKSAGKRR